MVYRNKDIHVFEEEENNFEDEQINKDEEEEERFNSSTVSFLRSFIFVTFIISVSLNIRTCRIITSSLMDTIVCLPAFEINLPMFHLG